MKYRIERLPGQQCWFIRWKRGIFRGTEKEYAGGGLEGYPVFVTKFFDTKKDAQKYISELIIKDNDKGEKGDWL